MYIRSLIIPSSSETDAINRYLIMGHGYVPAAAAAGEVVGFGKP